MHIRAHTNPYNVGNNKWILWIAGMFYMNNLTKFLGIYPATCFQKGPCEPVLAVFKAPI